ncbi:hypothetical protein OPV22_007435 [Ensete ventricosum]|uniref:Uncharacterized protein n=1 Tax=Ensete ventricosum TaxID=4639 RepID=A0AAV8RRQ5_ENSVE|nr:hypothetical protein OPV22_007435 [Ensete ventricosum]
MEKWVTPLRKEQGTPLLSDARGSMMAFFLPRHYKEPHVDRFFDALHKRRRWLRDLNPRANLSSLTEIFKN